jgi:hypothetical protein
MDGGKKRNPWMSHVKSVKSANKGKSFKQVLKIAAKTYKKTAKRGGSVAKTALPLSGGKRHKTRRGGRKH